MLLYLCIIPPIHGQQLSISVSDKSSRTPVEFAAVSVSNGTDIRDAQTDADGHLLMRLKAGTWHISVSALGYNQYNSSISLKSGTIIAVELIPTEATRLGEVVVTAKESKGMTSASLIDGTAMEHLQPSSFTDLAPLPADKDFINPERIKNQV